MRRTLLLVAPEYPPDPMSAGIGTYTRNLARLLRDRGHEVHVLARVFDGDDVGEEGITVHREGPYRPHLPSSLKGAAALRFGGAALRDEWTYRRNVARRMHRLVREAGVELIEACDHMAEAVLYAPAVAPAVPLVVRLHTPLAYAQRFDAVLPGYARRVVGAVERRGIRKATHVTAPTRATAGMMRRGMGLGALPIAVHANPVPFDPSPSARPDPRPAFDGPPQVLFVGRLSRWKGIHLLAEAIPRIHAEVPEAEFVFLGSDHGIVRGYASGTAFLRARIPAAHLDRVRMPGHVAPEAVSRFYAGASVCVFPSLFESFSYVCLEAMIHGKAVVGSRAGGMADLLGQGEAGLLFDPPDVATLASHVTRVLRDDALRDDLGRRARRRAETVYAPATVMDEIERFHERAITEMS